MERRNPLNSQKEVVTANKNDILDVSKCPVQGCNKQMVKINANKAAAWLCEDHKVVLPRENKDI